MGVKIGWRKNSKRNSKIQIIGDDGQSDDEEEMEYSSDEGILLMSEVSNK